MKNKKIILSALIMLTGLQAIPAQETPNQQQASRERREQAYVKLLEGQRYIWNLSSRSRAAKTNTENTVRMAKQSLQKAVELDPTLAEGYTALAELTLSAPPNDLEQAIILANIAVKLDAENFGGHRLLGRLYTIKSRLNKGSLDANFAEKAIAQWKEVARLDSRNAEAFAFLSEFYERAGKTDLQIDVLNKWLSSSTPLEPRFYQSIIGGQLGLTPESASLKLGAAFLKTRRTGEAVEILSRAVADNPENEEAVELLRQAVESADNSTAAIAVQSLRQAVYANPDNTTLIFILAQTQAKIGQIDDAAKVLRDASANFAEKDKNSAAVLQVALGDLFVGKDRFDEAVKAYQSALTIRGIGEAEAVTDDERDFAIRVFEKMIDAYKKANRPNEVKAVIERSRIVLGKNDLFADKKLISFYRETGNKGEALKAVRALRAGNADDYSLLRLEATVLTESGKINEAVALVKPLIGKKSPMENSANIGNGQGTGNSETNLPVVLPMYDDFSNYLFIVNLYSQAKRDKESIEAANQAYIAAQNSDKKQIAKLTLASLQQTSGDYQGAETTLRELLIKSPRNPIALNNLGYFLAERDEKLDEALKLIQQALEIDANNPSYLDSLGWTYFKLGRFDEAEKYLMSALRIDDISLTIQEHLGDVYEQQGKLDLAKQSWQKALNLAYEAEDLTRIKLKLTKGL